ncbi:flavin reductase family protein [Oceanicola sp. 22II-s10i]|uniref:flavin reductase family protein n=1 Tax=Oceanicola sp. 22II-s10i TaxID=1317116 RepID=UPI0015954916|nr:flavin reductase family protein [Oceanicola sp. 22II-s10i]
MSTPAVTPETESDADRRAAYRRALGTFPTGVTIVTGRDSQGQPRGFTANSFTSVSLDPPIVLFCVKTNSASGHAFSRMQRFTVNILTDVQRDMAMLFASRQVDKFRGIDWERGAGATPKLTDPLAWFECSTMRVDEVGDHFVIYGEVELFGSREDAALGFHRGGWAAVRTI